MQGSFVADSRAVLAATTTSSLLLFPIFHQPIDGHSRLSIATACYLDIEIWDAELLTPYARQTLYIDYSIDHHSLSPASRMALFMDKSASLMPNP